MADETPAPLSDAEIAEIARDVATDFGYYEVPNSEIRRMLATLAARDARLAALERENAAMREIVAAVAALDFVKIGFGVEMCPTGCGMQMHQLPGSVGHYRSGHGTTCTITRARALLGTTAPQQATD